MMNSIFMSKKNLFLVYTGLCFVCMDYLCGCDLDILKQMETASLFGMGNDAISSGLKI